jgi:uncharacterized protein (DUF427 family)
MLAFLDQVKKGLPCLRRSLTRMESADQSDQSEQSDQPDPSDPPESVWDYPRPPAVRASTEHLEVHFAGTRIAATDHSWQVLETSHPPTYYLPFDSFADGVLVAVGGTTWCEFKGTAAYFDVVVGDRVAARAAWHYPDPVPAYAALRGHVAVMPASMDSCWVDGEQATPQEGGFYGGWITSRVTGPFKGAPGTRGW